MTEGQASKFAMRRQAHCGARSAVASLTPLKQSMSAAGTASWQHGGTECGWIHESQRSQGRMTSAYAQRLVHSV